MQTFGLTQLFGVFVPRHMGQLSPQGQQQVTTFGFTSSAGDALYDEAAAHDLELTEAMAAAPLRADMPLVVLVRGLVVGLPMRRPLAKAPMRTSHAALRMASSSLQRAQ
jgi:hypothetical protein